MTILTSALVLYDYPYQIAGSVPAYVCLPAHCLAMPQYACQQLLLALNVGLYLPCSALPILHMHQAEACCFIASDTEYIIPVRVRLPLLCEQPSASKQSY